MASKSFAELKRNNAALTEKLSQEFAKADKKNNHKDDRYWTVSRDKAGNGYAIIRFLPNDLNKPNWVEHLSYSVEGPGGWYIENCRKTLDMNEADPMSEYNTELWQSGIEKNRELASKQKIKRKYITNILVVNDPENPENNGKVFLFAFGKKILNKCNDMINPQFADDPKVNVFDMWNGANFKLKVKNGEGGFPNYDRSEFDSPSAISDDDSEIEKIWNSRHDIMAEVAPEKFKPYDVLKARFDRVFNRTSATQKNITDIPEKAQPAQKESSRSYQEVDDDDDELAEFKKLANS